ncbi:Thrombospondin type 1 repeats protein [Trebouxia sp. C0009 RCD-2024]
MSQYLRVSDCNINLTFTSSTDCPATGAASSNSACADGQYICRGVIQVPQDMYTAVQDNECTPNASGTTTICQGNELDLTTYLSIQQGQCCLQCPGQPDCTADASEVQQNTSQPAVAAHDCGSFTVSIAVGSSLEGISLEDLLDTAVSGGLLDLYLQASALPDASVLTVGPTEVLLKPPPQAPQPAPQPGIANSTLFSAAMNITTGSSCSVQLQEDTLLCQALPGYLADLSHCTAPPQESTWRLYGGIGCKGPHWEYTPWGQCSAKCGGGSASRQALCLANASDASVAQPSVCADLPMPEPLVRQCNLSPCEIHTWSVGPWGACTAPCQGQS